jgi:YceI-like domain
VNAEQEREMKCLMQKQLRLICLIAACAIVAGCAPRIPLQAQMAPVPAIADFPESYYLQAEALGKKVLHVDTARSLVVFEVRRAGALARFGHDHVVASHDVKGFVAPMEGRADLYVPLARLVIDEAALRREAGFDGQPTQEDIEGTRRNMLDKVLQAERFPAALIHIVRRNASQSMLDVSITLHGMTRTFEVPAVIEMTSDGMIVSGKMHFNQTDFGIVPFSVLNGALQVQDRLDMRFRIVAVSPAQHDQTR